MANPNAEQIKTGTENAANTDQMGGDLGGGVGAELQSTVKVLSGSIEDTNAIDWKKQPKVKMKALQELRIKDPITGKKIVVKKGAVIELPKALAEMYTKPFDGQYSFSGERHGDTTRFKRVRAEIVKKAS